MLLLIHLLIALIWWQFFLYFWLGCAMMLINDQIDVSTVRHTASIDCATTSDKVQEDVSL